MPVSAFPKSCVYLLFQKFSYFLAFFPPIFQYYKWSHFWVMLYLKTVLYLLEMWGWGERSSTCCWVLKWRLRLHLGTPSRCSPWVTGRVPSAAPSQVGLAGSRVRTQGQDSKHPWMGWRLPRWWLSALCTSCTPTYLFFLRVYIYILKILFVYPAFQ